VDARPRKVGKRYPLRDHRYGGFEEGDVNHLSHARRLTGVQGRYDRGRRVEGRRYVSNWEAHTQRRAVLFARHIHDPAHGLNHRVVGLEVSVRTSLSEAGDRAINELRVTGADLLVGEAEPLHSSRAEILDEDVSLADESQEYRPSLSVLDVQTHTPLAPVVLDEVRALALHGLSIVPRFVPTPRLLHLDHISSHIPENHSAHGSGYRVSEFDDSYLLEGRGGHSPSNSQEHI
jgi:hypothetical protein